MTALYSAPLFWCVKSKQRSARRFFGVKAFSRVSLRRLVASSSLAGNGVATRREWTPEESARFEFELCRLLATDRGAQSVYFRKLSMDHA